MIFIREDVYRVKRFCNEELWKSKRGIDRNPRAQSRVRWIETHVRVELAAFAINLYGIGAKTGAMRDFLGLKFPYTF